MAQKGTRNTRIAFGSYEIAVAMKKCASSRDLKTELVDADGKRVGGGGGGGGGRRASREGESRAVRISDEHVVRLPQDRLDVIEETSKARYETMQVLECIDYRQVPTERLMGSYWLQPREGTAKGLRLLADTLAEEGLVAVVKWVATSREKLGVIRVRHVGQDRKKVALLLSELSFANDFLEPDEDALAINDVDAPDERSLDAARRLVGAWRRERGDEHLIDTASDEAVDARLALLTEVQDEALTTALEAATGTGEIVQRKGAAAA